MFQICIIGCFFRVGALLLHRKSAWQISHNGNKLKCQLKLHIRISTYHKTRRQQTMTYNRKNQSDKTSINSSISKVPSRMSSVVSGSSSWQSLNKWFIDMQQVTEISITYLCVVVVVIDKSIIILRCELLVPNQVTASVYNFKSYTNLCL